MKKRIMAIMSATILGISALNFSAFAETTNTTNEAKNNFQKPENEIFGKITAISEDSVTISVAEFKQPENGMGNPPERPQGDNDGNPPERPQGDNGGNPPERPQGDKGGNPPEKPNETMSAEQIENMKKNLENMFTLTGETKTINIKNAEFGGFGREPKKDSNENNNSTTIKENTQKTYKDFAVGDYISIELTSSTSNQAKKVRAVGGMMRGGQKKDFNKSNTNQ